MSVVRYNGSATITPAPGSVGSAELTDGSIATADIADGAVTTGKLADGAVTAAKIAAGAAVPTTRALAGLDLSADRTAAALQAALGIAAAPALPTSGLVMDFDASALSLGAVSSWASSVGTFVAEQATGSRQPVAADYAVGGHRGVVFDGVDDFLAIPYEAAMDSWTTIAVYVVAQLVRDASNGESPADGLIVGRTHSSLSATSPFYQGALRAASATGVTGFNGTSWGTGAAPDGRRLEAGPHIFSTVVGSTGSYTRLDGHHAHAATGVTSLSYANARGWAMGAGDYAAPANFCRVAIARVLIYGGVTQSAATRHQIEAALAATYGISAIGRTSYG